VNQFFILLRKILISLLLLLTAIFLATVVYFHHYRAQIIERVITEFSKKLQYPLQAKQVSLTILDNFPKLSLVLHKVSIQHPVASLEPLLQARKIRCSFDIIPLLKGQYVLDQLCFEQGRIVWIPNQPNPFQWKEQLPSKQKQVGVPLTISLHSILLKNMEFVYSTQHPHQLYRLQATQVQAQIKFSQQILQATLYGKTILQEMRFKELVYNKAIPLSFQCKLSYNQQKQVFTLYPSKLKQEIGTLVLQGHWSNKANGLVDITLQGQKLAVQTALSYLPARYNTNLEPYQVQGDLAVAMHIKRKAGKHSHLGIQAVLDLSGGQLLAQPSIDPINIGPVQGKLVIPDIKNLKTGTLHIAEYTSQWGKHIFVGQGSIVNLHDFYLKHQANVSLDVASLVQALPQSSFSQAGGKLMGDWKLEANLRQLITQHLAPDGALKLVGKLNPQGVYYNFNNMPFTLQDQPSSFLFQEGNLTLKNVVGKIGSGNFALQGTLKNLLPFLLIGQAPIDLRAKIYADYIDLAALLPISKGSANQAKDTLENFILPSYWSGELVCDIQELHYKRFCGKQVQGKLYMKNQKLRGENLTLGFAGGQVVYNGFIDAHTDSLHNYSLVKLQGVQIDKLFYSFDNFQQQFLQDQHLGGRIFTDCVLSMEADKQGNINWNTLQAEMASYVILPLFSSSLIMY